MKRGGRLVIQIAIAFLFTIPLTQDLGGLRDTARLGMARFFTRPWFLMATRFAPEEESPASRAADPDSVSESDPDATGTGAERSAAAERTFDASAFWQAQRDDSRLEEEPVPILEDVPHRRVMLLGAGWRDGVRPGQVVFGDGVFLGFVDRVEEHLSRARLPSHPGSRFGAVIRAAESPELLQTVLLAGEGSRYARASAGRRLADSSLGGEAWRPYGDGELLVGKVGKDAQSGEVTVVLDDAAFRIDYAGLADAKSDERIPMKPEAVFSPFATYVLSCGDSLFAERSLLVAGGSDQGVGVGDALVQDGRLLGIISSIGMGACRVRPYRLEEILTWRVEHEAAPEGLAFYTRQRRRETGPMLPEGLHVEQRPEQAMAGIRTGSLVEIHRFAHRDERQRLLGKWRR